MAIVEVEGYSFSYPAPPDAPQVPALSEVGLSVEEGAFCVLVGPTGCGKTTLLRSMKPELLPVGRRQGTVRVLGRAVVADGEEAGELDARASAEGVGMVMQDPSLQIVCDTVWHELAFGLENLGVPPAQMRRRVAEVAHFFGIEPWVRSSTETLSGGQKQIVNLAAALALRPRLLLLDEPCAQLDPNAVKRFLFLLARVNRELGVTVVMTTHTPEDVEPYLTQRIDLGPMGSLGTCDDAIDALRPRWRRRSERLRLVSDAETAQRMAHRASDEGAWALDLRDIYFRYERTAPWILRGLSMKVARGSIHAIVGGNGCGKSTLLRVMAGVGRPQRGTLRRALADSQAMLPQDPKALFVCDSVAEEIAEWRSRCGYTAQDEEAILARFALQDLRPQHPYDLSGGQQQKLALAKVLLTQPQLLLLDEPTKGLDPWSAADVARCLRELADEGRTIVLVTHDLDFALVVADEVSMVFDGELACTQPSEGFFADNLVYRPNAASRLFGLMGA